MQIKCPFYIDSFLSTDKLVRIFNPIFLKPSNTSIYSQEKHTTWGDNTYHLLGSATHPHSSATPARESERGCDHLGGATHKPESYIPHQVSQGQLPLQGQPIPEKSEHSGELRHPPMCCLFSGVPRAPSPLRRHCQETRASLPASKCQKGSRNYVREPTT